MTRFIHDSKIPRQSWRLGKVERLLPGQDGHVRSALVRVKSGNSVSSEWRRPLQRLYPLEVTAEPDTLVPHRASIPITVVMDDEIPNVVVNTA